jgi:PST family polysaccharide transporter
VLGVEQFGLFTLIISTITYFKIIIDYGFNLTAIREIIIHQNNNKKIIEIFNSVIIIKLILCLLSLMILTIMSFYFDKIHQNQQLYFLAFITVIGEIFFPTWFFQGMEKIKPITFINLFSKILYTIAIFYFVQDSSDIHKIFIINAIIIFFTGLYSFYLLKKYFNIYLKPQGVKTIFYYLRDGWYVFISNIAISFYTVSTIFILGLFADNATIGYFSAAEKIIQAFKMIITPLSQALYPHVIGLKNKKLEFIWKLTLYLGIFTGILSIFIFIFADVLIYTILGKDYTKSILPLKIMSFLPLITTLSNIFGVQTILAFGEKKNFSLILITGALLGLIISLILVPSLQHIGSAITQLVVELLVTCIMFFYILLKIRNFNNV